MLYKVYGVDAEELAQQGFFGKILVGLVPDRGGRAVGLAAREVRAFILRGAGGLRGRVREKLGELRLGDGFALGDDSVLYGLQQRRGARPALTAASYTLPSGARGLTGMLPALPVRLSAYTASTPSGTGPVVWAM